MLDGTRTVPGKTGLARAKVTRTSLTLRVPDARGHFLPIIAAAPDLPGSARRSAFYSSTTSSSCFAGVPADGALSQRIRKSEKFEYPAPERLPNGEQPAPQPQPALVFQSIPHSGSPPDAGKESMKRGSVSVLTLAPSMRAYSGRSSAAKKLSSLISPYILIESIEPSSSTSSPLSKMPSTGSWPTLMLEEIIEPVMSRSPRSPPE